MYKDFHSIVGQGAERFLQDLFLAKILTGIKTFKSMSTDQIDALCASATTKHYAKGEDMVRGDVGNELFIVIRGKVSFPTVPNGKSGSLVETELGSIFLVQCLVRVPCGQETALLAVELHRMVEQSVCSSHLMTTLKS